MALRQSKRISELNALTSASLNTTVLGVDNGTTYRIELDVLADSVSDRINIGDRTRLDSLEQYTASFSSSSDLSLLNTYTASQNTLNTAFQNGINARLQTSSFNDFSASVNTRLIAATNEQSFNGLISGSSQLTSSYDTRYVISGSITQTTWDNIANKPSGIVSQSVDIADFVFTTDTITNSDITLDATNDITLHTQNGNIVLNPDGNAYIGSANAGNGIVTDGYLAGIIGDTNTVNNSTGHTLTDNLTNIINSIPTISVGTISGSAQITALGFISSSQTVNTASLVTTASFNSYTASISTASLVTSITQLNTYTASVSTASLVTSISNLNTYTASQSTASLVTSIGQLNAATSSYETKGSGIISGSSQLPAGLVSGSSQVLGGSGVVSGSYETTGRSIISSSAQITTLGFVSSSTTINTSSLATTGSNSFNGNQTITGSVIVSSNIQTVNGYVHTSLLYNGGPIEIRSNFQPLQINSNGAGTIINDATQISGSLRVSGSIFSNGFGLISGSSQLTASLNSIYAASGSAGSVPAGTISGSAQITSFGFVSGSYETTGRSIFSGSSQITGTLNLTNLSATSQVSASVFVGGFGVTDAKFTVIQSKAITFWPNISFESVRFTTGGGVLIGRNGETNDYGLKLDVSGSTRFTGNMIITGSLLASNGVSGSIAATNGVLSGSAQITSFGFVSGSYETTGRGILSSSTNLVTTSSFNDYTASISTASLVTSITQLNTYTASQSTASLVTSISNLNSATSSYETMGRGIISGSSQLTSSYDARYTLSGSVSAVPSGTISGSSQLTSSFDLRYLVTGSVTSSIIQLNSFTASISTASLVTSITQLNSTTASLLIETLNLETFSSSVLSRFTTLQTYTSSLNTWTSSVATTGSNSFNGNQTITGSLTVSSVAVVSASVTLPSGSILSLTSGSSILVDATGAITGSLTGSVFGIGDVVAFSSSVNSRINNITTGSLVTSITQLNSFTASQSTASLVTSITQLNTYTASISTASLVTSISNLNTYTASVSTASLVTSIAQLNTYTASVSTASLVTSIAQLNTYTASVSTASLVTSITQLNSFSASENTKASALATYTSSLNVWTSSVATTGSNSFNGSQTITGSLLVSGSSTFTGSISISSGSITMPNRPGVRVTGAGGAKTAVTTLSGSYLNVDWQQSNAWDNSTGTFTAPIAGLYQVNVVVRTNSNSLGTIAQLIVYKNNTGGTTGTQQIMIEYGANTTMNHTGGSTISKLAVGDTLKMVVAVGELSFDVNDNFSVAYIG